MQTLNYLACIRVDCSIWSARAKILPSDLDPKTLADMPPDQVATLGSKRLFDPAKLKIFGALKARAVNLLDKRCVKFLGGWATHEEKLDFLGQELAAIAAEFEYERQKFCNEYVTGVAEWAANFPEWSHILINSVPKLHDIERKFSFTWQTFKIEPAGTGGTGNDLRDTLDNMNMTIIEEVAAAIADANKRSFEGRTEFNKKCLRPIKTVLEKVRSLSFVHPDIFGIEQVLDELLATAHHGFNDPRTMRMMQSFMAALSTVQGVRAVCDDYNRNKTPDECLGPFYAINGDFYRKVEEPIIPPSPEITLPPGWTKPGIIPGLEGII